MNLLARHFGPQNLEIDTTWAGDITYVRTSEGWAYLAVVLDLATRRVGDGLSLITWKRRSSATPCAWRLQLGVRRRDSCFTRTEDPGQDLSDDFRKLLRDHHVVQSPSRPKQCWDNAVVEAWFGT